MSEIEHVEIAEKPTGGTATFLSRIDALPPITGAEVRSAVGVDYIIKTRPLRYDATQGEIDQAID